MKILKDKEYNELARARVLVDYCKLKNGGLYNSDELSKCIKEKHDDLLQLSIDRDGVEKKLIITVEECSELQHSLCKLLRKDDVNKETLTRDIADLEICIENLKLMRLVDTNEVNKMKDNIIINEAKKYENE